MPGEYGYQPVNFTLVAANAIAQYHIVQASGTGYGGMATTDTQVLVGVAQQAVIADDSISVCPLGLSKVVAGASISLGARITSNASARAVAATSGDVILGYAREAATADGDVITAFIAAFNDKMIA